MVAGKHQLGRVSTPDHVSARVIAGEAVLLNLESGQYHGLDATGTTFWHALKETSTFDEALGSLRTQFVGVVPERIAADLEAFCRLLEGRGLVEIESVDC